MIVPRVIRTSDSVKKIPWFGKLVFASASIRINNPIKPMLKAIFCLVETPLASGEAKDILCSSLLFIFSIFFESSGVEEVYF